MPVIDSPTDFSKFFVFLFEPSFHWLMLIILLFLLVIFQSSSAIKVCFFLALYYALVVISPLSRELIFSLEKQNPPIISPEKKMAVVVLTGSTVLYNPQIKQFLWLKESGRILEPLRRLMKPDTILILSGAKMINDRNLAGEAQSMKSLAMFLGTRPDKIIVEAKARSTKENAIETAKILQQQDISDFYLVTSAYHMPRAKQSFVDEGLEPTAFPVNFKVMGRQLTFFSFAGTKNIQLFKTALHEYIGSLYYWFLSMTETEEIEY